jgi:hypothetical protein
MTMGRRRGSRIRVTSVVLALVCGLGAAACAKEEATPQPGPTPTPESTTTTEASTTTTTQDEEADEALAEEALLTVDEVPGGPWQEGDARVDEPGTGLDCEAMPEESEYFDEHGRGAPGAKAPELDDETTGAQLQLDVELVASDEVGAEIAGFFADDRFAGCLEERLLEETSSGSSAATISDVRVETLDLEGTIGDSASAWSVSFTVEQGTQSAEISGVIGFAQVGRGFANVSIVAETPVGVADLEPILAAAADKLETTLG